MIYWTVRRIPILRNNFPTLFKSWGHKKVNLFKDHISIEEHILDLGCGSGLLTHHLMEMGYTITPVDVSNNSLYQNVNPEIYNGSSLEVDAHAFDVVLLITVLHHCTHPESVLQEALRVGKRVIIIEDTYTNSIQKWLTFLIDGIVNWGTSSMPFQNKKHTDWITAIEEMGGNIQFDQQRRQVIFLKQSTFVIDSPKHDS